MAFCHCSPFSPDSNGGFRLEVEDLEFRAWDLGFRVLGKRPAVWDFEASQTPEKPFGALE